MTAAAEVGMVRLNGLECPLDIFRRPNEIEPEEFDEMWERSSLKEDGVRLLDPLDLLISKEDTGRASDLADQSFLQQKVRLELGLALSQASPGGGGGNLCPVQRSRGLRARAPQSGTGRSGAGVERPEGTFGGRRSVFGGAAGGGASRIWNVGAGCPAC